MLYHAVVVFHTSGHGVECVSETIASCMLYFSMRRTGGALPRRQTRSMSTQTEPESPAMVASPPPGPQTQSRRTQTEPAPHGGSHESAAAATPAQPFVVAKAFPRQLVSSRLAPQCIEVPAWRRPRHYCTGAASISDELRQCVGASRLALQTAYAQALQMASAVSSLVEELAGRSSTPTVIENGDFCITHDAVNAKDPARGGVPCNRDNVTSL